METIFCPTDFTKKSENSIRYADEIAQRMNSRVILFHNICANVAVGALGVDTIATETGSKQLQKLKSIQAELESTEWGIPVSYETMVSQGDTQLDVPLLAEEENAGLIVLGTGPSYAKKNICATSLTGQVIERASCPVLVIPENTSFKPIRKMVLATDLRGFSVSDMAMMTKLASYFGAHIQLLHIIAQEDETARQFAQEELERLSKRLPYQRISMHIEVNPIAENGIKEFCQSQKADMLVVGAHTSAPRPGHPLPQPEHTYLTFLPLLVIHARKIAF